MKNYDFNLEIEAESRLVSVVTDDRTMKIIEERLADLITEVKDAENGHNFTYYSVETW